MKNITIETLNFPDPIGTVTLKRVPRRRNMTLRIKSDGQAEVLVPKHMPKAVITGFVAERSEWIASNRAQMLTRREKALEGAPQVFSEEALSDPKVKAKELRALRKQAKAALEPKLELYAAKLGVTYNKVSYRLMTSRWGSCSSSGNISLNVLLVLVPEEAQDYVVVHELCHRKEMNHSKAFWALVESALPNYREPRRYLKEHAQGLMAQVK